MKGNGEVWRDPTAQPHLVNSEAYTHEIVGGHPGVVYPNINHQVVGYLRCRRGIANQGLQTSTLGNDNAPRRPVTGSVECPARARDPRLHGADSGAKGVSIVLKEAAAHANQIQGWQTDCNRVAGPTGS